MDEGKILIASLPKRKLGEPRPRRDVPLRLRGAAMSRVNVEPERRRPFFLRLDEAHALATLTMADILQEARKYGLGLVMAHQYLDQMELEVQKAILAHVGTLIAFKVGPYDAEVLAKYFAPEFNEAGLMHLGRGEVYLRLMMGGVQSEAFSARTLLPDLLQLPS